MAELDPDIARVVDAARRAIEDGHMVPLQYNIPDPAGGMWVVVVPDLEASGRNDVGIRYRPFVHAQVAALALAVGAEACLMTSDTYVTQTATPESVPDLSLDPAAGEALVTIYMAKGLWGMFTQSYHRDDAGRIVWDPGVYREQSEPGPVDSVFVWGVLQERSSPILTTPPVQAIVSQLRQRGMVVLEPGSPDA